MNRNYLKALVLLAFTWLCACKQPANEQKSGIIRHASSPCTVCG